MSLVVFILINAIVFTAIYAFLHNEKISKKLENSLDKPIKEKEEKSKEQKPVIIKQDAEYWWYNKPYYWIMSNGEKFNIADYVRYEDWKDMSKEKKIQMVTAIENRILSTKNKENEKYN